MSSDDLHSDHFLGSHVIKFLIFLWFYRQYFYAPSWRCHDILNIALLSPLLVASDFHCPKWSFYDIVHWPSVTIFFSCKMIWHSLSECKMWLILLSFSTKIVKYICIFWMCIESLLRAVLQEEFPNKDFHDFVTLCS